MALFSVDEFFTLNRRVLLLSLIFIFFGVLGAGQNNLSTLENYLYWGVSLSVFLFTIFIEIRNLFPSFRPWSWFRPGQNIHDPVVKVRVGIAAGIALIAVISFGWPALLVVGIALLIFAATRWANE